MTNLLANADFGGGTYPHVEWGWPMHSTQIPEKWHFWWHGKSPGDPPEWYVLPECGVLRSGDKPHPYPAYDIHCQSATMMAILQQVVVVPRGTVLRASAKFWPWSSPGVKWSDADPLGSFYTALGIDTLGRERVQWDTPGVVWSPPMPGLKAHSREVVHEVRATAQVDRVTFCALFMAEWALLNNRCVLWGASLEAVGGDPPEPPDGDIGARLGQVEGIVRRLGHETAFGRDVVIWRDIGEVKPNG